MWPEEPRQDECPKDTDTNEGMWPEEPRRDKEYMCHHDEARNEWTWPEPKGGVRRRTFSGTPLHGNERTCHKAQADEWGRGRKGGDGAREAWCWQGNEGTWPEPPRSEEQANESWARRKRAWGLNERMCSPGAQQQENGRLGRRAKERHVGDRPERGVAKDVPDPSGRGRGERRRRNGGQRKEAHTDGPSVVLLRGRRKRKASINRYQKRGLQDKIKVNAVRRSAYQAQVAIGEEKKKRRGRRKEQERRRRQTGRNQNARAMAGGAGRSVHRAAGGRCALIVTPAADSIPTSLENSTPVHSRQSTRGTYNIVVQAL